MNIVEAIISLVAPYDCLGCGQQGLLVCSWCWPDLFLPVPTRCYKCLKSTASSKTCLKCRRKSPLTNVWVSADYEALPKRLVSLLKFGRNQTAADIMASYMAENLPVFAKQPMLVSVPTATSRVRQRGYDQAKLIAKNLAKTTGYDLVTTLGRLGQTRQVGAKRAQRAKQLAGAFYIKRPLLIKGANILLVDDVITTGATLEAAAKVLKTAGAKTVSAIVFAQRQ